MEKGRSPRRARARLVAGRVLERVRGEQSIRRLVRQGLRLGHDVKISSRTIIDPRFAWAVEIGSNTTIAHDVRIIAHDAAGRRLIGYTEVRPVSIGSRCYIGAGSIILPGTTIGDRSFIGAGSVVRGTIPSGVVAAGNPARVLRPVTDYEERQRQLLAEAPRYELRGREIAPALWDELREHLDRTGRVFIR